MTLTRELPLAGGMFACACLIACGDTPRSPAPPPVTSSAQTSTASASETKTINDAIELWKAGDARSALDLLKAIAAEPDASTRLRLFTITEVEYRALPQQPRDQVLSALMTDAETLRAIGRELIEKGQAAAAHDDERSAREWLSAARVLGKANSAADLVLIGRHAGETVRAQADRAMNYLDGKHE